MYLLNVPVTLIDVSRSPAERKLGPNEKPVLLQKRKFEQAGYTELDKLEELGREDNSYLSKLVYKATYSSITTGVSFVPICLPLGLMSSH